MSYIGRQISNLSDRVKLDSITASATATYNLLLNTVAYVPSSAESLTVSLNGVIQAPQDSYTVSGSQITFASALTSSDSIDFILAERSITLQTPSSGSVNTEQLANSSVTNTKVASSVITSQTEKTSLADADKFLISDSAASGALKYVQKSNLGAGGLIKISSGNWSSGTDTLTFSSVFDGTYKTYLFYLNNIYSSSDYRVSVQFERGGSFITATTYYYACQGLKNGNTTQIDSSSSSSAMVTNAANAHGGAAAKTYSLAMNIFDPYNSTSYTQISGKASMWLADDSTGFSDFVGLDPVAASVTGFRLSVSGNIGANAPYLFYGLKS